MIETKEKYLSLNFNGDTVVLQYHPDTLRLNESSNSNSVSGLNSVITYVSNPKSIVSTIDVACKVTVDDTPHIKDVNKLLVLAGISAASALGIAANEKPNLVSSGAGIVSVAKGIIDLSAGLVLAGTSAQQRRGFGESQIYNIAVLREKMYNTDPCSINWDVDNNTIDGVRKYFIKNLSVDTMSIQRDTGTTMAFALALTLMLYGEAVKTNE